MGQEKGQVLIEYLIMLSLALAIVLGLNATFKKTRNLLWMKMACDVSAPCPHCQADEKVKTQANQMAPGACQ